MAASEILHTIIPNKQSGYKDIVKAVIELNKKVKADNVTVVQPESTVKINRVDIAMDDVKLMCYLVYGEEQVRVDVKFSNIYGRSIFTKSKDYELIICEMIREEYIRQLL